MTKLFRTRYGSIDVYIAGDQYDQITTSEVDMVAGDTRISVKASNDKRSLVITVHRGTNKDPVATLTV